MKNKKAQLKIQQMTFMLIAITLFFVLVGLFVLIFKMADLKKNATEIGEENAMLLVEMLADSPEFACTDYQGSGNCIDLDKIMVLKDNQKYESFWKVAGIEIIKIYPETGDKECDLNNYPDCNKITILSKEVNKISKSSFVNLCRKEKNSETGRIYDQCDVARLLVSYEVEE